MNILQKVEIGTQFRFQFPMIICAIGVIVSQRKIIGNTLKMGQSGNLGNGPKERLKFLKIFGVGVIIFFCSSLVDKKRIKLQEKIQQETVTKMLEEKLITIKEFENHKKEAKRVLKNKQDFLPFYNTSRAFSFITIVIIAPIVEECVFRYLIFEIFGKSNPFSYIFSSLGFIFLHWGGGILNFTTIKFLLLCYLPMTIFFIWTYKKSKWNITYPIFFHFLGNSIVFLSALS